VTRAEAAAPGQGSAGRYLGHSHPCHPFRQQAEESACRHRLLSGMKHIPALEGGSHEVRHGVVAQFHGIALEPPC
jgi:hypothetical protein